MEAAQYITEIARIDMMGKFKAFINTLEHHSGIALICQEPEYNGTKCHYFIKDNAVFITFIIASQSMQIAVCKETVLNIFDNMDILTDINTIIFEALLPHIRYDCGYNGTLPRIEYVTENERGDYWNDWQKFRENLNKEHGFSWD